MMENNLKEKKISFIIPIRNRDKKRIKNCVKSLKSDITGEIIIIDYVSDNPITAIPGTKIIRYNKNNIWNKAHAINLGIKFAENDYIGTVDCDMIISKDFMKTIAKYLDSDSLIYSLNLKRIKPRHVSVDFKAMLKKSSSWFEKESRKNLIHNANGGIQVYSKKWIYKIGGADESLIYWGGIDNDIFERAVMCGLSTINLNKLILHQEHKDKKEENLPEKERVLAFRIRVEKVKYLEEMFTKKKYIRNDGKWGLDKPNQKRFLKLKKNEDKREKKMKIKQEKYNKAFMKAAISGKRYFFFGRKRIKLFKDT